MGLSISIEVTMPENIDEDAVTRLGLSCYPHGGLDHEPMTTGESIQWAFQSGGWALDELAALGVTWEAQHQAR